MKTKGFEAIINKGLLFMMKSEKLERKTEKRVPLPSKNEFLASLDRLGPTTHKELAKDLGWHLNTIYRYSNELERRGTISYPGGQVKIRRMGFRVGSLMPSQALTIINEKNPNHLEKLTNLILEYIPKEMTPGEKRSLTSSLKQIGLPKSVSKKVKMSYLKPSVRKRVYGR